MRVTVIATVRDEEKSIGQLIESILAQTRKPDEIVIVDGGSTDRTIEILGTYVRSGAPLIALSAPGANISQGRNAAIRAASGDVIAATDAGVRLEPDWIENIVEPFFSPGGERIDVVCGFFKSDPHTPFELALGATTLPDVSDIDPERFLPSSRSVAFRRDAWERIGGYPEGLDYCEDVIFDLDLKARGARLAFVPGALVHFRPRSSLSAFFRQYYLYARGDGKARLWPRRHVVRYAAYALGPFAFILGFWYKVSWLVLALAAVVYLYRPYRRLAPELGGRRFGEAVSAITMVPIVRLVGDVAKMIGYPAGVVWRLRHGPPPHTRPVSAQRI